MQASGRSVNSGILLLARLALGAIFVSSGYGKIIGFDRFGPSLVARGVPSEVVQIVAILAVAAEFGGGCTIVLGLFTRYAAWLMVAFTIVATGLAHRYWEYADAAAYAAQMTNFMKNLAIIGGFLALSQVGGGRFSLDGVLFRST
jgi:putative oxidoreductase